MRTSRLKSIVIMTHKLCSDEVRSAVPKQQPEDPLSPEHMAFMFENIVNISAHDPLKAQRWLGFVQGILVAKGAATVDQLANIVREAKGYDLPTDPVPLSICMAIGKIYRHYKGNKYTVIDGEFDNTLGVWRVVYIKTGSRDRSSVRYSRTEDDFFSKINTGEPRFKECQS